MQHLKAPLIEFWTFSCPGQSSEHCRAVVDKSDLFFTIDQKDEETRQVQQEYKDKDVHTYKDKHREEDIVICR